MAAKLLRFPLMAAPLTGLLGYAAARADVAISIGHRIIGDQHYIQTEQVAYHEQDGYATEFYVAAHAGAATLGFRRTLPTGERHPHLAQFAGWGAPLHDFVDVEPLAGAFSHTVDAARFSEHSCVMWVDLWRFARVFDALGQPLGPSFIITEELVNYPVEGRVIMDADRLVFTMTDRLQEDNSRGVFVVVTDWSGNALSGVIPIATNAGDPANFGGMSAFLDEGEIVVAWSEGDPFEGQTARVMMRRIHPDLSLSDPLELVPPPSGLVSLKAVTVTGEEQSRQELLVIFIDHPAQTRFAQRFSLSGTPLGEPQPLFTSEHGLTHVAASSAGRLIVLDEEDNQVLGRLYDADAVLQGDPFVVPLIPTAYSAFLQPMRPAAFDDDTLWIVWHEWDNSWIRMHLSSLRPFTPGDMNRDGLVNNFDIDAFVFALSNLPGYAAAYNIPEDAAAIIGDINEDGVLNNFDIDPFVMLLAGR